MEGSADHAREVTSRFTYMTWREYHELTKHSVESLRRTQHYLDWANMPNPFRHYEGVPILDFPADPPAPQISALKRKYSKAKTGCALQPGMVRDFFRN